MILITTKSGKYNEKVEAVQRLFLGVESADFDRLRDPRATIRAKIADFFKRCRRRNHALTIPYTEVDYKVLWERRNDKTENRARPWVIPQAQRCQQQAAQAFRANRLVQLPS